MSTALAPGPAPLKLLLLQDSCDHGTIGACFKDAGVLVQLQRVATEQAFIHALGEPVDMIVSHLTLREFNATSALSILQFLQSDIPLLVIAELADEEQAQAALCQGAVDVLSIAGLRRLPRAVLHGIELARLRARLRGKQEALLLANAHLERLSLQLIQTQERERISLARELHDELGQRLTAIRIKMHHMHGLIDGASAESAWHYIDAEVVSLIHQIRTISVSLRPPALDYLGLETALRQLLDTQLNASNIAYVFEYAGLPQKFDAVTEMTIYRLIQESLTNIVRHAHAACVVVELNGGENGAELELIVRDNGCGFDTGRDGGRGAGLLGMRERIKLLGGSCSITSAEGSGTRIAALIPLKIEKHPHNETN